MLEIHGDATVPDLFGHRLGRVALVVGGIVDQDLHGPEAGLDCGDCAAQRPNVGEVARFEVHRRARIGERLRQIPGGSDRDVEEGHLRLLTRELAHDELADAGAAAGHQHDPAL